jgi:cation diffusion facilitator CzcD-associated flavoprotein CzcO
MSNQARYCVIGAGAAGLAAVKTLSEQCTHERLRGPRDGDHRDGPGRSWRSQDNGRALGSMISWSDQLT